MGHGPNGQVGVPPHQVDASGHDHRFACVSLVPLFASLPEEDRHRIAALAVTRDYDRQEQVHRPGDRPGLHIVHRGKVKVYRLTESGTEQLIRILFPGDFLGEAAVLSDKEADSFAVAIEPSEVCAVGRAEMRDLLAARPAVALGMLHTVSGRLHTAEQLLSSMAGRSVAQRLAEHLLQLSVDTRAAEFRLPSTKKDLASYLGTTPETLSRRLADLQSAGLIRLGVGRAVEILDGHGLHAVAASPA